MTGEGRPFLHLALSIGSPARASGAAGDPNGVEHSFATANSFRRRSRSTDSLVVGRPLADVVAGVRAADASVLVSHGPDELLRAIATGRSSTNDNKTRLDHAAIRGDGSNVHTTANMTCREPSRGRGHMRRNRGPRSNGAGVYGRRSNLRADAPKQQEVRGLSACVRRRREHRSGADRRHELSRGGTSPPRRSPTSSWSPAGRHVPPQGGDERRREKIR
jgi:hypothetical protein